MAAALSTAALVPLLHPARASALTANLTLSAGTLSYQADLGEVNNVSISSDIPGFTTFTVTDSAGLIAGTGCSQVDATTGTCPGPVSAILVKTGDLADTVNVSYQVAPSTIFAGAGNDTVFVEGGYNVISGQGGNDVLSGGSSGGHDVLLGGPGNDQLYGGPGGDRLDGGPGADVMDGGSGPGDVALYDTRTQPVSVTIDGVANDGQAGEGDNVSAVEDIVGGSGDDTLVGALPGKIYGEAGNDHLSFAAPVQGTLLGGPGNDVLTSPGTAALRGNSGNDILNSQNGYPDWNYCASGDDTVIADATDYVAPDCEHVAT